jgi:hypothetical protein
MTTRSQVNRQLLSAWNREVRRNRVANGKRYDIDKLVQEAERHASRDVRLLQPWLRLFDEGINCALLLHDALTAIRARRHQPSTVPSLLGRFVNLLLGVRRLVLAGLEQPAQIVARSAIETAEVAIISFFDSKFAADLIDENGGDKFWQKHVAYGKAGRTVDKILRDLGLDEELVLLLSDLRSTAKRGYSAAVHTSPYSTIFTSFVLSLAKPGMVRTTPLGHHSNDSPLLLDKIVKQTHMLVHTILHGYVVGVGVAFAQPQDGPDPEIEHVFVALNAYQSVMAKYLTLIDELPDPFEAAERL